MLDTNVLLAATDAGTAEHDRALAILNDWPGTGTALYTSGQIVREYLAVATRPAEANGLGLSPADALANARAIRQRTILLAEDAKAAEGLLGLIREAECTGKRVHDAKVVATMLAHGIGTIVTINVDDFRRFEPRVRLLALTGRDG